MKIQRHPTILIVLFIVLFIVFTIAYYFTWRWVEYRYKPITASSSPKCVIVKPGATATGVAMLLDGETRFHHPYLLTRYLYISKKSRLLKAGEYCFDSSKSASTLIGDMIRGKVTLHAFTIIEGETLTQVLENLQHANYIQHSQYLKSQLANDANPYASLEGWLLPETYLVAYGTKDEEVIQFAHKAMQEKISTLWPKRKRGLPYKNQYQALIAASIIEKESAKPQDRVIISSVIVNRLNKHMMLQMDPTVIYGLQGVKLTKAGLNKKTAYNTYMKKGLPPTPICMPSLNAIEAALHPIKSDYYYFVAKGEGYHQFSSTLAQQQKAIRQYLIKETE